MLRTCCMQPTYSWADDAAFAGSWKVFDLTAHAFVERDPLSGAQAAVPQAPALQKVLLEAAADACLSQQLACA